MINFLLVVLSFLVITSDTKISFKTYRWSKNVKKEQCGINQCYNGELNEHFLANLLKKGNGEKIQIDCIKRPDSKLSVLKSVEAVDLDGYTHILNVSRYNLRECVKRSFPDFVISVIRNDPKCKKGTIKMTCLPCKNGDKILSLDRKHSLKICPPSKWIYKLVGGLIGTFLVIGLLFCVGRLLVSIWPSHLMCIDCLPERPRQSNRRNDGLSSIDQQLGVDADQIEYQRNMDLARGDVSSNPSLFLSPPSYKDVIEAPPGTYKRTDNYRPKPELYTTPNNEFNANSTVLPSYEEALASDQIILDQHRNASVMRREDSEDIV